MLFVGNWNEVSNSYRNKDSGKLLPQSLSVKSNERKEVNECEWAFFFKFMLKYGLIFKMRRRTINLIVFTSFYKI